MTDELPVVNYLVLETSEDGSSWTEWTDPLVSVDITRGGTRRGASTSVEVGTLDAVLKNEGDPTQSDDFMPNLLVRVRHRDTGETVFTGRVVDVDVEDVLDRVTGTTDVFVTVSASDAVNSHESITVEGVVTGGGDTYEQWGERVDRLADYAVEDINPPDEEPPVSVYAWGGDVGDLDGWASFGSLPSGLDDLTDGASNGVARNVDRLFGSPSVTAGQIGVEREFTGLEIGREYTMQGVVRRYSLSEPPGNVYRFAVPTIGGGSTVTVTGRGVFTIPSYTFTATSTTHTVKIELYENVSVSTGTEFESVTFQQLQLVTDADPTLYRLQDNALNASLADHFTITCDTVGAAWWVDSDNVTQFRRILDDSAVITTITDTRADGEKEYTGITASYSTRNVVNRLEATNHGRDPITGDADDTTYTLTDPTSITTWGPRKGSTEMSLRSGYIDQVNLHPCPGVEGTTWADYFIGGTNISAVTRVTDPHTGTYSARGTTSGSTANLILTGSGSTALTVTPGEEYTVSFWVKSQVARTATINMAWRQANGTTGVSTTTSSSFSTTTGWTLQTFTDTAPVGGVRLVAYLATTGNSAGQFHYIDDIMVSQDAATTTPFSGATTPTDDYTYEWDGTEHESTSSRRTFELLNDRLTEIVDTLKDPARVVSALTWNALEDTELACTLDIQDRILVRRRGDSNTYRITGMRHHITPNMWSVDLNLTL